MSWNVIQQTTVEGPVNEAAETVGDRSRALKRTESKRSTGASKSPRRNSDAAGSDQTPLTADQRLDRLLIEYRNRTPRGGDHLLGGNLLGSPLESPISPSQAV